MTGTVPAGAERGLPPARHKAPGRSPDEIDRGVSSPKGMWGSGCAEYRRTRHRGQEQHCEGHQNPRSAAGTESPGQAMAAPATGSGTSTVLCHPAMHDPRVGGGGKGSHEAPAQFRAT